MAATRGIQKAFILPLVVLVAAAPFAPATTTQNDAGLGLDVPNTRDAAALVSIPGSYQGQLTTNDVDWYRANVSSSAPLCVNLASRADPEAAIALEVASGGTTTRAFTRPSAGSPGAASLAFPAGATVRVEARAIQSGLTAYGFDLTTTGAPSVSAGDAFSGFDAGSTLTSALRVSPGCVGGHMSIINNVAETRDVYALSVAEAQQITYSFATSAGRVLQVQLLDTSGNAVGQALPSGGAASFVAPSAGTYFLAISSSSTAMEDTAYTLGITLGPPEPGSACRPQC